MDPCSQKGSELGSWFSVDVGRGFDRSPVS